jgi:hypothetical protein
MPGCIPLPWSQPAQVPGKQAKTKSLTCESGAGPGSGAAENIRDSATSLYLPGARPATTNRRKPERRGPGNVFSVLEESEARALFWKGKWTGFVLL